MSPAGHHRSPRPERTLRVPPGPVFTKVLLADEINRTPPKTQAALLEAMQERQVTVDGGRRPLRQPFFVLATQNPVELEGTYPLPEAQLDRFLLRVEARLPELSGREERSCSPTRPSASCPTPPVPDLPALAELREDAAQSASSTRCVATSWSWRALPATTPSSRWAPARVPSSRWDGARALACSRAATTSAG